MGEPFRFGRVVGRSFAIWGRELPMLLALALVVHLPRVAIGEALVYAVPIPSFPSVEEGRRSDPDRFDRWVQQARWIGVSRSLVGSLFADLSVALVIFAVYVRLQGRHAGFGACARGGLARVFPVLRVSACLFVLRAACWYGLSYLFFHGASESTHAFPFGTLLLWWIWGAGPLLVLLLSPFWVATAAAVVEAPRRLLRRSWRLTRGHRIAVLAIMLSVYAIDWGSDRLLHLISGDLPWLAQRAVRWAQDLVVVSLSAVFAAVGYHALRLEKEGVDVSKLEDVFA